MFRIGQKIVCVDASKHPHNWRAPSILREGAIYTVKGFEKAFQTGIELIVLEESNVPTGWFVTSLFPGVKRGPFNYGYRPSRFRPVVEKKNETGMEMLRKLQDPANHQILEDA